MSRRKRLFLGIVALFALGIVLLLYRVAGDLDSRYRESTEETLVDVAYFLAATIETDIRDNTIDSTHLAAVLQKAYGKHFEAKIFGVTKRRVDFRVYITDARGIVLFDSTGRAHGQDFSQWNDVSRVLAGQYGARTSPDDPARGDSAIMYVAAPIMHDGRLLGVASVGKPTASQSAFVATARQKLVYVGIIAVIAFLFFLVVVTVWLTRPFGLTSDLVRIVRQEGLRQPEKAWRQVKFVLGATFNDMRDALAGRSYTEDYIQTLTHELKSPLSAIRGAAELLREPLPAAQRERFTSNIGEQVLRLQDLAERLLELASLEKQRTLAHVQPVNVTALAERAIDAVRPTAQVRQVSFTTTWVGEVLVNGDEFLLYQAMVNMLNNAVDFAPAASAVEVTTETAGEVLTFRVRDHGTGIPDFALDRVFDKFYSLPRPATGRKSTGLGLAFVRDIAQLHGGKIGIANHPDGGALAVLRLPLRRAR